MDAQPESIENRTVRLALACALFGVGGPVCLAVFFPRTVAEIVGTMMLGASAILFLLARPRKQKQAATVDAQRTHLKRTIAAAITRGDHLATITDVDNWSRLIKQYENWGTENYDRLNEAIGPTEADAFATAGERVPKRPDSLRFKTRRLDALCGCGRFSTGWTPCRSWGIGGRR